MPIAPKKASLHFDPGLICQDTPAHQVLRLEKNRRVPRLDHPIDVQPQGGGGMAPIISQIKI